MNAKGLLNTDVEVAWQWCRSGFSWWIAELSELLPPHWRERFTRKPAIVLEYDGTGLGRSQSLTARAGDRVRIVLPRHMVLLREFTAPLLPLSDIRRMAAHDIDRLTPFRIDAVYFDVMLLAAEDNRSRILLGAVPRRTADDAVSRAEAAGLKPVEMKIAGDAGQEVPNLDFLSQMRQAERGGMARRQVYWWGAVGALTAANLFLLIMRDTSDLNTLQGAVDAQATSVAVAERIGDKVQAESARRAQLVQMRANSEPLRALDAATRAIPRGSWVQRFEWNGSTVHLAGLKDPHFNVLAGIEASPLFRNARGTVSQISPKVSGQPYDITANVEGSTSR